ncbi:hypothetical protein [Paenibacillus sp. MZ03-122A]|uniref:hypothetical protein n=1 Tax=Paenibacillus sp. MZ03-122A TaxID=2962033 RepID=UPI0020B6D4C7|nr:hypothetical protein [Paenibacillus sp. MZ03-122A]MCP3777523.1 hypothetical protein [Paenibacillus sp. MZ03-122A]
MNLLFIPGLYFYIYLGIGLIVGYWFVSKELTERAQEMQQENQEENDRNCQQLERVFINLYMIFII